MKATGVKIDIKDPYFKTISRQKQLSSASNITDEIYNAALELIKGSWTIGNPIRLLTVTGINPVDENEMEQLSFLNENKEDRIKNETLDRTMDAIRNKFGGQAITFGSIINNDLGIDMHEDEEWESIDSE
jgi:DNA polymerase-4